jgi:hypothetical protein
MLAADVGAPSPPPACLEMSSFLVADPSSAHMLRPSIRVRMWSLCGIA